MGGCTAGVVTDPEAEADGPDTKVGTVVGLGGAGGMRVAGTPGGSGAAGGPAGQAGAGPSGPGGTAGTGGTGATTPAPTVPPQCTGGGSASGGGSGSGTAPTPCDATAACAAPNVCIGGFCQPPLGSGRFCDGIDVLCPEAGTQCIAGYCQRVPGACVQNQDCPAGYACSNGTCSPPSGCGAGCPGGQTCVGGRCVGSDECRMDSTLSLAGDWTFDSTLHLRQALAGAVRFLLSASEVGRSLVTGDLTALGVPSWAAGIVGPLVQGIVNQYIPPWGQNLIVALGDVSDVLDTLQVKESVSLSGDCPTAYRGRAEWQTITLTFRGQQITRRPVDIPQIGMVRPEEFGAKIQCGQLYIDRHRVRNVISGLLRWVLDEVTQVVTCTATSGPCFQRPEDAVRQLADCSAIGNAIAGNVFGLGSGAITAACQGLLDNVLGQVTSAIDASTATLSVLTLQGEAAITSPTRLGSGRWNGSLVGSDFPGEFTAAR